MDISWKITKLTAFITLSGFDDVVCHARWTLRGTVTGSDIKEYASEFQGATPLTVGTLTLSSFTPYEDLTQDQVIGWVKASVNYVPRLTAGFQTDINKQMGIGATFEENPPWAPADVTPAPSPSV